MNINRGRCSIIWNASIIITVPNIGSEWTITQIKAGKVLREPHVWACLGAANIIHLSPTPFPYLTDRVKLIRLSDFTPKHVKNIYSIHIYPHASSLQHLGTTCLAFPGLGFQALQLSVAEVPIMSQIGKEES